MIVSLKEKLFQKIMKIHLQAISILFLSFICGCGSDKPKIPPAPELPVITIAGQTKERKAEFVGQTIGATEAQVRARVAGILQSINFTEGKEVKEGQLLFTIEPNAYEAAVAESKAKLAEAETRYAKAVSDLGRIRPLAEIKAVSQRDLDAAIAQEGVAKGAVDAAKASLDASELNLSYTKITAPFEGIISISKAKVGEYVGATPDKSMLAMVTKIDPIHVRFTVTEKDYLYFRRMKLEQESAGETPTRRELEMELADGSIHKHRGYVVSSDSTIDSGTGTLIVEAEFPNPDKVVLSGQFAKVRTIAEVFNNAIIIPRRAVREIQGVYQAYLVDSENKVNAVTIKVESEIGNNLVVSAGLKDGDRIVADEIARLKTGMPIRPVTASEDSALK